MFDFLFDTSGFPPRWECGQWTEAQGWLHILSDLGIWSAYFAIPCLLVYFVLRKRDVPFPTIFWLFGAFILACGTTHLMEAIIFWQPLYRLAGVIKLVTFLVSWLTVAALVPTIPKALAMRSPEALEREVAARQKAELALQQANADLEQRVAERTAELAKANATLRYEREMLRITLSSIGDGVITSDTSSRVTFLNPVAEALTAWANQDAAGQPLETVFRIINETTRKSVDNPVAKVLATGHIVGLANHTVLIAQDGTERAIDDSAAPISEPGGRIAGVVLVFRDVTEQRRAERATRLLAALVESSEDAIIGKDINGVITSWNRAAGRIFGYAAAEAVGQSIALLAPPDHADEMPAILTRIRQGEQVDPFDTVRRAKDGRLVPISLTVSPIKDGDGQIVGASKIARDISQRKQAEAALHEEKERLHATLTGIGDAVIVTDAQGLVTLMNPVAQALTGWRDEARGRPLDEVFRIVNEQTGQPVESPVGKVIRDATVVGLANHTALIARDGSQRPIEDSAAPVRGKNGEVAGVVLVFRDASERRAAEAAAQKYREIFQLGHRIGKIGHWEWNSLTDENNWSPEIEALYGLAPGTFAGTYEAWTRLLHPDDLPKAEEDVRQALETGKYFTEFRVIWPDGSIHWLEARANVFKDGHDKPVRVMGVNMDVTERKEMEEALRRSETHFRQLAGALQAKEEELQLVLSRTPLLLTRCSRERRYVFVNRAYAEFLGRPAEETIGRPIVEIMGQEGFATIAPQVERVLQGEAIEFETLVPYARLGQRFMRALYTPDWNERGEVIGWIATLIDITDRKELERDREERAAELAIALDKRTQEARRAEEAERLLREADRRKNEFLATLAHELRNPLAPLRNAAELLHRAQGDATIIEQARSVIERQVQQMVRLIDDLLDIARITSGKLQLRKERVELAAVIQSAVESSRPFIEAQSHELTVTLPQEPIYLDADPTRLSQVFANLLTNAAKYTERGGHIWLSAERQGGNVAVSVRDTGIGIPAEHLPYIFEMFSQVAPALERSQAGLGIGLALVRGVVELHGGTVEAHSTAGKGSDFIVRLPVLDRAATAPAERTEEGKSAVSRASFRILIADDNRDAADSLAQVLRMMGHEIEIAHDGVEAVQAAATFRPDVALLDIGMPRMNGYAVARHMREQPWGQRMLLVALTGWGQEEDKRRATEAGFHYHLTKPAEPGALEKLLEGLAQPRSY
jgi:PAS domain S-box-containing protein